MGALIIRTGRRAPLQRNEKKGTPKEKEIVKELCA